MLPNNLFPNSGKTTVCKDCTSETGRCVGCKLTCERYLSSVSYKSSDYEIAMQKQAKIESMCGHYKGYTFLPSGKVKGINVEFLLIKYSRNHVPYVTLCENGISETYRLDKAMYRAYHPDFDIDGNVEVVHRDGNQKNCRISNLYIA